MTLRPMNSNLDLILKVMESTEGFLFVFNLHKMGSVWHFRKMTLVAGGAFGRTQGEAGSRKTSQGTLVNIWAVSPELV